MAKCEKQLFIYNISNGRYVLSRTHLLTYSLTHTSIGIQVDIMFTISAFIFVSTLLSSYNELVKSDISSLFNGYIYKRCCRFLPNIIVISVVGNVFTHSLTHLLTYSLTHLLTHRLFPHRRLERFQHITQSQWNHVLCNFTRELFIYCKLLAGSEIRRVHHLAAVELLRRHAGQFRDTTDSCFVC